MREVLGLQKLARLHHPKKTIKFPPLQNLKAVRN